MVANWNTEGQHASENRIGRIRTMASMMHAFVLPLIRCGAIAVHAVGFLPWHAHVIMIHSPPAAAQSDANAFSAPHPGVMVH